MELRDRAVGSESAQQAMLNAGSGLINPPILPLDQISFKKSDEDLVVEKFVHYFCFGLFLSMKDKNISSFEEKFK